MEHRRRRGERQRHRAASASCRRRAASAPSRWRARRSRTSPTTGAPCSASRPWCPASLPQAGNGGTNMSGPADQASGFTVNGQRPNSNNMTIDGVANIDTGDNGGNMATTNIDAVAEFKILTNAYQAEYGRAVGGQVQVVTKSGTQAFHGSGYWYGRRSGWNANTWTNKRSGRAASGRQRARSPSCRTPRATTMATRSAAPSTSRARSTRTRRSSSSSGARSTSAARTRWPSGRAGCPPPSSGAGTSPRASTTTATRSPTSVTTRRACPAPPPIRAAASPDGGVLGRIPQSRIYQPGPQRPRHLPRRELRGDERHQLLQPGSRQPATPRGPAAAGLPGHGQLALHRPLHEQEGRPGAGLRHHLGRQRAATTSTAWTRSSRTPARTTCSRPPASSARRRRSS